jgi:cation:H+ antiporter
VNTGKALGINEFLLVQWLAPLASEAPEFTVAIMLTLRGQAGSALGSLLSAKLNQWTLLVGMIPGVYSLSARTLSHPIPMGSLQMHEILLTAAQSLFAVMLLMKMRLTMMGSLVLFGLFAVQFLCPALGSFLPDTVWKPGGDQVHVTLSYVYLGLAAVVMLVNQYRAKQLCMGTGGKFAPRKTLSRS